MVRSGRDVIGAMILGLAKPDMRLKAFFDRAAQFGDCSGGRHVMSRKSGTERRVQMKYASEGNYGI